MSLCGRRPAPAPGPAPAPALPPAQVRSWIVPTNRRHPLPELMGALRELYPASQRRGDDFVCIEYVMLADVNDSDEDARRLLALTDGVFCMVSEPGAARPQGVHVCVCVHAWGWGRQGGWGPACDRLPDPYMPSGTAAGGRVLGSTCVCPTTQPCHAHEGRAEAVGGATLRLALADGPLPAAAAR